MGSEMCIRDRYCIVSYIAIGRSIVVSSSSSSSREKGLKYSPDSFLRVSSRFFIVMSCVSILTDLCVRPILFQV